MMTDIITLRLDALPPPLAGGFFISPRASPHPQTRHYRPRSPGAFYFTTRRARQFAHCLHIGKVSCAAGRLVSLL